MNWHAGGQAGRRAVGPSRTWRPGRPSLITLALSLLAPVAAQAQRADQAADATALLQHLVETYGVSGDESRVRELVLKQLPSWATPRVDTAGNVWVRVGSGDPVVVFIAHMDEVGFRVESIRDDGSLELTPRGGFFGWLWEATPAMVHRVGRGQDPVPGVFMPRDSIGRTVPRDPPRGFRVDVGARTRAAAEALGIRPGDVVTNPKHFVPLAGTRATGRSFDDRVGSAAQLIALKNLDRSKLKHEVVFVWSVREEVGLEGATVAARELKTRPVRVHAIDTFVSSESAVDPKNYAYAPLGQGPVARVVDNGSVMPPVLLDSLRALAERLHLPLQYGTTSGSTDGSVFSAYGVPNVAFGWPLRYSHSPVEVIDTRDLGVLADLIRAIAEEW